MDQISGLMPQVGWSPLMTASAPKKPPATTVEPATTSANTNSGLGANVDAQTKAAKVVELQARAREMAAQTAVLAQSRAAEQPDPDAPTGPPPTFDVTPLEAQAAELRRAPQPEKPAPVAEAKTAKAEAADESETEAPVQAEEPPPVSTHKADWHASDAALEPQVDVTR